MSVIYCEEVNRFVRMLQQRLTGVLHIDKFYYLIVEFHNDIVVHFELQRDDQGPVDVKIVMQYMLGFEKLLLTKYKISKKYKEMLLLSPTTLTGQVYIQAVQEALMIIIEMREK